MIGAESGVDVADDSLVFYRDDQTVTVKVRLGENKVFEQRNRERLHQTTLPRLTSPDFDQLRRVAVSK